ncbi:MAG: chemotaxis protein CheC [Desulfuromonas sp.]|nr:MAG: chemotaxis protein CheC [Desulfuromonas sp.]
MSLLTEQQFDTLKEVVNIGVGRAASSLNEMLDAHIELQVPSIYFFRLGETEKIPDHLKTQSLACVQMGFQGTFSGTAALVFPPDSAAKLVTALTGESAGAPGMNAVMAGTLNEVGNILLNGVMGTIGNILSKPFDYSFPNYLEGALTELLNAPGDGDSTGVLMVQTNFRVEELEIEGNVFLLFETKTFTTLIQELDALMHET